MLPGLVRIQLRALLNMTEDTLKKQILDELDATEHDFHYYPHYGLHPDYFQRYWDLWKLCYEYFYDETPPYFPPDLC